MRMSSHSLSVATGILLLLAVTACVGPPRLAGVGTKIEAPAPNVPKDQATFLGTWGGYWGNTLASNLIVDRIPSPGTAHVIYSWATNEIVSRAGTIEEWATVKDGTLAWGNPQHGIYFKFSLNGPNSLFGQRFTNGARDGIIDMERIRG